VTDSRTLEAAVRTVRGVLAGPGARFRFERPDRFEPPALDRGGLYIHVPFCRTLCPYCPYNRIPFDRALADAFVDGLGAEAEFYGRVLPEAEIDSVYVGGGTPTSLGDDLFRVLATVERRFRVTGPVCLETHPAEVTRETAGALRSAGVVAVSLGVESFQPRLLNRIGRQYSGERARNAIAWLHDAGIPAINVDLMFALPSQTLGELDADLDLAAASPATQVTAYPLFTFPYTAVGTFRRLHGVESPPLRTRRRMYYRLSEFFERRGWHRASVWSYQRAPADSMRYSSVMRRRYLGLGPGAGSWLGSRFTLNTFSVPEYVRAVARYGHAVALEMPFTRRLAELYELYWDLYGTEFAVPAEPGGTEASIEAVLSVIAALGLAVREPGRVRLTRRGAFWVHLLQNQLSLRAIDRIWSAARAEPWPVRVEF